MQNIEIRVRGQIDKGWSAFFDSLAIAHTPPGDTVLTGSVRDQAELRGVLTRLADLGLDLISVNPRSQFESGISRAGGELSPRVRVSSTVGKPNKSKGEKK